MGAGGETLAATPPRIPEPGGVWQEFSVSRLHSRFSHTAWKQKQNLFPDTIQPTVIHWYPPPTLLRTRDIHLLTSNRLSLGFVLKYQCIVQELSRNIMHHTTHHSFALFLLFFYFCFFFFIYKSSSVLHTWFCPFLFLFKNQSVRLYPGAHGGTGYGAKWHALAGTHSPHFLQGQVNQEAGQDTTYPQREAAARSKVPLHVQGQVVRPGETPGGRNSERKGEKQGQAGATKAIKCDQR